MQQPGAGQMIGEMVIPGMIMATLAMVVLIVFVYFIGKAINYKKQMAQDEPPSERPGPAIAPVYASQGVARSDGSVPDTEVMAVISAAISCVMDTPYAITNVTPAHPDAFAPIVAAIAASTVAATTPPAQYRRQRPVWGFAGMQQNTRPF